jgi:hypothetical protein
VTAPTWLDEFFGPAGPPIDSAATGTIDNITTTKDGISPQAGVRFTGVAPSATGFDGGTTGRRIVVMSVGGPLELKHEASSSLAANRIDTGTGADVTIAQGGASWLLYDSTSQRWRLVAGPQGVVVASPVGAAIVNDTAGGTVNNCTLGASSGALRRLRFTNASGPTITGFSSAGVADGTTLRVLAVGGTVAITHQGGTSSAANRCTLAGGTSISLTAGTFTEFEYDSTSQRWRHLAATAI